MRWAASGTLLLLLQISHGDWKNDAIDGKNTLMFLAAIAGFSFVFAVLFTTAERLLWRRSGED